MQIPWTLETLAVIIIVLGFIILMIGCLRSSQDQDENTRIKRESKAIVFIGPVPLVWGFSRKTQAILAIVAITIFIVWIILQF